MNRTRPANARLAAVEAIATVLDTRQSLSDHFLSGPYLDDPALSPRDKPKFRGDCKGVSRNEAEGGKDGGKDKEETE